MYLYVQFPVSESTMVATTEGRITKVRRCYKTAMEDQRARTQLITEMGGQFRGIGPNGSVWGFEEALDDDDRNFLELCPFI